MIKKAKKKAFAFIESLIILMLVILLVTISLNLINLNYLKAQTYKSYSDKKSLNLEEEIILKEINIDIEGYINNEKKYKKNKYSLIEKDKIFYIVRSLDDSKIYIELEIRDYNNKKIFIPTYYKTENIKGA